MTGTVTKVCRVVLPLSTRQRIKSYWEPARVATGWVRSIPDYLIIGAQKAGTTTLAQVISEHPEISQMWRKEVHYFTQHYTKGRRWYCSNFPLRFSSVLRNRARLCGDATPYYLAHPKAPERCWEVAPHAKLIALLRNPVDRAISHYHHEVRHGYEVLPIDQALEAEPERLRGEVERIIADPSYYSFNHQHFSYVTSGLYLEQLKAWREYYPKRQMLIIKSEEFLADPERVLHQVLEFLGVSPSWRPKTWENWNVNRYDPPDPALVARLRAYFKPHNRALYDYLGVSWDWDAPEPCPVRDKAGAVSYCYSI